MEEERIETIAITGSPCGGKSSGLSRIVQSFSDYGWRVLTVPEVATLFIMNGLPIAEIVPDPEKRLILEKIFLQTQLDIEKHFTAQARIIAGQKKLIVCDRGAMDVRAYLTEEEFSRLLHEMRMNIVDLRDRRYKGVFHMVTAADGAEAFYTLKNNAARSETPEEARELDKRTQAAWWGHEHFRIIDNSTGFEEKLQRLIKHICHVIGVPTPIFFDRRFMIESPTSPIPSNEVYIEQIYLSPECGIRKRIRKRRQDGRSIYFEAEKIPTGEPGEFIKTERIISKREYMSLKEKRDPNYSVIHKRRRCFSYKHQYLKLDEFLSPLHSPILEVEATERQEKLILPPFLRVSSEVTGNTFFGNESIAALR